MKKILCFILPLVLTLSCQKQPRQQEQDPGFTLRAGLEEVQSKTTLGPRGLNDKSPVYWANGDAVSVNGVISRPLTGESGTSSSASFVFDSTPASAAVYNVLYPGTEEQDKLLFDGRRIPLYGHITTLSDGVTMRTPSAVVRFKCRGTATLTRMVITSMKGEKLYGKFTLAKDSGGALTGVLTPAQDASASIDYVFDSPLVLTESGQTVSFVIPAGNYAKGLKAVLTDNCGQYMTLRFFLNGASIPAAQVCAFQPVDYLAGSEVTLTQAEGFGAEDVSLEEQGGLQDMGAEQGQSFAALKVGTYNIWAPSARKSVMDADPEVSAQRSWANSYESVADMINYLDCDIIGIQEVTKMVYQTTLTTGNADYDGNVHTLNSLLPEYSWVIYNAANTTYDNLTNNTTANGLGSTDAILYKGSVLTLVSKGRYWLTGTRKKAPQEDNTWDGIGTNRPATWAKFTHKASGKQFVFIVTHLDLPNAGEESNPAFPQRRNATELIGWMAPLVCPENIPSIIVGDMNVDRGDAAGNYDILVSGRWKDVYDTMKETGTLDFTDLRYPGTMNADKRESGLSTWRPDHIFTDGFSVSYYKVGREKFATRDGTLHYPSDHLPIKIIANF